MDDFFMRDYNFGSIILIITDESDSKDDVFSSKSAICFKKGFLKAKTPTDVPEKNLGFQNSVLNSQNPMPRHPVETDDEFEQSGEEKDYLVQQNINDDREFYGSNNHNITYGRSEEIINDIDPEIQEKHVLSDGPVEVHELDEFTDQNAAMESIDLSSQSKDENYKFWPIKDTFHDDQVANDPNDPQEVDESEDFDLPQQSDFDAEETVDNRRNLNQNLGPNVADDDPVYYELEKRLVTNNTHMINEGEGPENDFINDTYVYEPIEKSIAQITYDPENPISENDEIDPDKSDTISADVEADNLGNKTEIEPPIDESVEGLDNEVEQNKLDEPSEPRSRIDDHRISDENLPHGEGNLDEDAQIDAQDSAEGPDESEDTIGGLGQNRNQKIDGSGTE
ncbi:hypothetical protein RF11_02203 [Thelohanellus kitauei]|uniref:Uncharacterized protein n=1 Tax=Thelohanellus kitauei TaxID=669202 RepID=A0A0C2MGA0_THEKT|nr:hypothetical protein RF11_02203 [Thelohanellus kitauei]